jgi:superfamily II DNA or RNA helicase
MNREDIQFEAIAKTDNVHRCTLVLATGVGKTLVGLTHMDRNTSPMDKVLVVAPKKAIFKSWSDDAVKFDKAHLLGRIVFTTYLSISKHDPRDYQVVYLDEAHSLLESHRTFLDSYRGKIVGLTGTPPKVNYSIKGKLVDEFCPVVYTFKADDAVDNGILNNYQIIVHKLKLGTDKTFPVKANNKTFMVSEKDNYVFWSNKIDMGAGNLQMMRIMRMRAMMEYRSKESYVKKLFPAISRNTKAILFANTQEQADRLCAWSYHSNNPESDRNLELFSEGVTNQLSCVMQLSEGINIPNLKQGIIMHAYGNERKSAQRIGRLLRLNPDDTAIVHILCYMGTIDEKWVTEALEGFDQSKIEWKDFNVSY